MAQKHLQLLRNNSLYNSYELALSALTGWDFTNKPLADGTPILARYTDNENNQKTLLGVVNNGTIDIINNVADYLLRNYTAFTGDVTTITSADDVKTAIAKLEKHIADVAADITVTVEEAQDANTQAHLDITATTSTTEGDTYTIGLKDVASESALTAEITARKAVDGQTGQTYVANSSVNYISNASSLNDADVKLDAALKAEEDARKAIEGQNGSTYIQNASSRYISGASDMNDADVKLDQAVSALSDNLDDIVEGLTASTVSGESKVVIDVTQEDGKITATAANLTGVKLAGYAEGTDADVAATDTLGQALGKLQAQINAMDKTADAVAGQVVTTVAEADGKVTETKANVKDLQLGGYSKTNDTGAIASGDTVNVALSKLENQIGQNTITNVDGSINVVTTGDTTDVNVNIKSGEKVLAKDGDAGLYTDLDFVKITTGLPATVKERYQFLATDNSKIGVDLDIPKDSHIVSINYITTGEHAQNLEYVYIDVSGNTQTTYVDMSELVLETEFASGVTVTDHVAHGVVDSTSEKNESNVAFLTVGADGFKVSGIKDAIDTKINKLDVTGDTAVAGQYVAAIEETDGVVAVKTRANVSEAVLNNYAKGSDSGAVASTDTVNEAISKLENQVDKAKAAATTEVVEGTDAGDNLSIASGTAADGHVTYTVNLTDVASASALTNEISYRKAVDGVNGNAYTADTNGHYIAAATTLYSADQVLDTAIYNEVTARTAAIEALDVTGDTAVAGQYVAAIEETDGIVAVKTRANVSEAVLNNYTKGSDSGAVASTDTVNQAISKLENQIDAVEGDYLKNVVVNNVTGTVNNNVATVDIGGADIKLSGYTNTTTGTPAATDTVNQAISKLYNKGVITSTNSGITVDQSGSATTLTLNVSTATAAAGTTGATYAQAVDGNAIELKNDGIFVSSNWDCGTY